MSSAPGWESRKKRTKGAGAFFAPPSASGGASSPPGIRRKSPASCHAPHVTNCSKSPLRPTSTYPAEHYWHLARRFGHPAQTIFWSEGDWHVYGNGRGLWGARASLPAVFRILRNTSCSCSRALLSPAGCRLVRAGSSRSPGGILHELDIGVVPGRVGILPAGLGILPKRSFGMRRDWRCLRKCLSARDSVWWHDLCSRCVSFRYL
jgi:hypothetical protein